MAGWRKGSDGGGRKTPGDGGRSGPARRPARPDPESRPSPKPARASWRKSKDEPPVAASGSASGSRYYRTTGGFFGFLGGRRLKLWVLGGLFTMILGGIVWLLFSVPSRVPIVAVAVSAYRDPRIPQNLTALTDMDRIEHLEKDTADFRKVEMGIDKTGRKEFFEAFSRKLKEVTPGGSAFSRKSVIIYINAHGVVSGDGKACLLLADSDPLDDTTWFPLADVLAAIKNQPGFPDATKLVALDCCRIRSDWRLGILDNRFVDHVREEVRRAEIPNLAVLTSAGPSERAWPAPELGGGTVFGHFLAVGLRGAAARHATKISGLSRFLSKETLSVGELCGFVGDRVAGWVGATRGAEQHPQLISRKSEAASLKNSDLAWISHHKPSEHSTAGALRQRDDSKSRDMLAQLKHFWGEHQKRQEALSWRMFPIQWAEFEHRLLRFEELYLEAVAENEALDRARKEVEDALKSLNDPLPAIVYPGSAALAKYAPGTPEGAGPGTVESSFSRMVERYIAEEDRGRDAAQIALAVRTRRQMEELAAPDDPRVLYWLRPSLSAADQDRRRAEDLLFVGDRPSLDEAQSLWSKLHGATEDTGVLAQIRARSAEVAEGYRRRDEIWTRLWWLTQWLDREEASRLPNRAKLAGLVESLVASSEKLDRDLESMHESDLPPLAETLAEAVRPDDALREEFNSLQKSAQRSRDKPAELQTTRSFGLLCGLFELPLVSGSERDLLREKYDQLVARLADLREDLNQGTGGAPVREDNPESDRDRRVPASGRLVMRLLGLDEAAGDAELNEEERLLHWESGIRKSLAQRVEAMKAAAASEKEAVRDRSPGPAESAADGPRLKDDLARRAGGSAADLAGRRCAWFVPRLDPAALRAGRTWPLAARSLMQFDRAVLALWHCDRALDDFWGPVPGQSDREPYFALAAQQFLAALTNDESIKRDPYVVSRRTEMEAKLGLREKSTRLALRVQNKSLVFEADVAERKQAAVLIGSQGAPAGVAAVFVADSGGSELDRKLWRQAGDEPAAWRQGAALPADPANKPSEFTILRQVMAGGRATKKLAAGALFRGHLSNSQDGSASFDARLRVVRAIEPDLTPPPPPQIKVKGSRHSVTELIFIVDASGSMTENVQGRETNATGEQKWTLARNAIQTIMSELVSRQGEWEANDEEWRAALMVYGHRAVWLNQIGNVQYNKAAPAEERQKWAAQQVLPHTDVEVLVDLARFDVELAGKINSALARATPWGPTPLYYALREAVRIFERAPAAGADQPHRHIILVTDGVNNPMPPKNGAEVVPGALQAALKNFKQTHQNAAIPIDVVYFGEVKKEERDAVQGLTNFVKEANALVDTGAQGKSTNMYMAVNPENLIYHLRSAVEEGRLKYRVVRAASAGDEEFKPANSVWSLPGSAVVPDRFSIQIEGLPGAAKAVRLEGGESLVLNFKKDKLEFEPQPADKGLLKRMTAATGAGRLNVYPFVPLSGSDDVLFRYGVQYVDSATFTPRPSDFWAEAVPVRQEADDTQRDLGEEPAVFYDRSYIAGQRMPTLQFKYPTWPAEANAARVKLWLRLPDERGRSPIEPLRIRFADVTGASAAKEGGQSLAEVPVLLRASEATVGNGTVKITVVEQQLEDGRPRDWCRIELSARPDSVTRRYFLGEGRAEHIFEYGDGKKPDPGGLEILVTPAVTIKTNAIRIPVDDAEIRPLPVERGAASGGAIER